MKIYNYLMLIMKKKNKLYIYLKKDAQNGKKEYIISYNINERINDPEFS